MTEREGSESRKQRRRQNEKREKVRGRGSSYLDPDLPLSPPCLLDSEVRTAVHLQRVWQFHSTDKVGPKQLQGKHVHRSEKAPTQLYQGPSSSTPFHSSRTVFPTAAISSFLRHSSRLTTALPHTLQTTPTKAQCNASGHRGDLRNAARIARRTFSCRSSSTKGAEPRSSRG